MELANQLGRCQSLLCGVNTRKKEDSYCEECSKLNKQINTLDLRINLWIYDKAEGVESSL